MLGLAGAQRPPGGRPAIAGGRRRWHRGVDLAANGVPAFASRIANGEPVAAGGLVNGLAGASDVLASADGAHLYAVAAPDAALAGFERGAGGALAYRETFFDGLGSVDEAIGRAIASRWRILVRPRCRTRVVDNFPPQFVAASWIPRRTMTVRALTVIDQRRCRYRRDRAWCSKPSEAVAQRSLVGGRRSTPPPESD